MPRKPRSHSPTGVYHWINRGVNRKHLFHFKDDYEYFLKLLKQHKTEVDSLVRLKIQPDYAQMQIAELHKEEVNAFRPPLSALLDHLDYIVKLIGVDHVGLGSDFDGIDYAPVGLDGVQDFPRITQGLMQRGYSEKDIKKILEPVIPPAQHAADALTAERRRVRFEQEAERRYRAST